MFLDEVVLFLLKDVPERVFEAPVTVERLERKI